MADQRKVVTEVEYSEYKGSPTIVLPTGTEWPFSFGVKKAKAVIENIDAIKKFIAEHDK